MRFYQKQPLRALFSWGAGYLGWSLLMRVILLLKFAPTSPTFLEVFKLFGVGLWMDLVVFGFIACLGLLCLSLAPQRLLRSPFFPKLCLAAFGLSWFGLFYLSAVEFFFFEEFLGRFNYIAVDYLIYPHEVFVNIWQSYPVVWVVLLCLGAACGISWLFRRGVSPEWSGGYSWRLRPLWLLLSLGIAALAFALSSMSSSKFSSQRVLNEVANNGLFSFFYSLRTNSLDYGSYYATLPRAEAWRILHQEVIKGTNNLGPESLTRELAPEKPEQPLNLVLIVMESFGAEFSKLMGGQKDYTPAFDQLTQQGLLFDQAFATGNRTIRGLEASLASFPPIPGSSVVKRDKSDHFFTLASALKASGYETEFIYGGNGSFDNMKHFMEANGFERFIEESDLDQVSFESAWGACDEDIYNQALLEFERKQTSGKPFFTTILTVSNHKPYSYPKGRIEEDPDKHQRVNAVKYADYALGQFMAKARREPYYKRTVFVIFGDHGARIYGSQEFPLASYQVPILMIAPNKLPQGERDHRLVSSLDISPTVLGLLGYRGKTLFYGRDLSAPALPYPFIFMQHNRDLAIYDGKTMVTLGLQKEFHAYSVAPENFQLTPLLKMGAAEEQLKKNAIAVYQTAYEAYEGEAYSLAFNRAKAAKSVR